MRWRQQRLFAIEQRCGTICELLGLPQSLDIRFVTNVLDRFAVGHDHNPDRAWTAVAYVLTQAFHCRVPTAAMATSLRMAFEAGSVAAVHQTLIQASEYQTSPQAAAPLVPGGSLAIDVTQTTGVRYTSGIQRVVRSLAQHVRQLEPDAQLIRWANRARCFTPLTAADVEQLLEAEPLPSSSRLRSRSPGARVLRQIGRAASWPTRRIKRSLQRYSMKARQRRSSEPSVFLWDKSLLVPELVVEASHIEAIRFVCNATPLRSTMVFFDAIPIRYPEFFDPVIHSTYLRSLSLARDMDAVSCISRTARDQLENLLAMMPRRWQPLVGVHYLGADLPNRGAVETATFDRLVVLCVGTVEPRKNQLRILRAMVAAQEAGADFTGVFAGYPGWLNSEFRSALATALARGHSLLLHESVTNAELRGLYQAAAFTIYASLDEGFGLPIIESLRHGRPCITSDRGSMREIADLTGGCLLIDPEDTADMATAIAGLFEVPDDLARLTLEAEQAEWPDWREYTEQLVRFATRPSASLKIRQRPAA